MDPRGVHEDVQKARFIAACHRVVLGDVQSKLRVTFHVKQLLRFLRGEQHANN